MITRNPKSLTIHASAEIDTAHDGTPALVPGLQLDLAPFSQLHIDVWCADEAIDVTLQRVAAYNAAGDAVWVDVATKSVTAAASDSVDDVATALESLVSAAVPSARYRIVAQLSGDTAPGILHVYGVAK